MSGLFDYDSKHPRSGLYPTNIKKVNVYDEAHHSNTML